MSSMNHINDDYGADSGKSIVAYGLGNLQTWRGDKAKAVKAELNRRLKNSTTPDEFDKIINSHFGHAGRPGMRGGSAPSGGVSMRSKYSGCPESYDKNTPQGKQISDLERMGYVHKGDGKLEHATNHNRIKVYSDGKYSFKTDDNRSRLLSVLILRKTTGATSNRSVGTGQEIYRLRSALEKGHVTEDEASKALAHMHKNGGEGKMAFAEDSLKATGADIPRIMEHIVRSKSIKNSGQSIFNAAIPKIQAEPENESAGEGRTNIEKEADKQAGLTKSKKPNHSRNWKKQRGHINLYSSRIKTKTALRPI